MGDNCEKRLKDNKTICDPCRAKLMRPALLAGVPPARYGLNVPFPFRFAAAAAAAAADDDDDDDDDLSYSKRSKKASSKRTSGSSRKRPLSDSAPAPGSPPAARSTRATRATSEQRFLHHLEALNLRLQAIPADGNCLFGAIASQTGLPEDTHVSMRELAVTYNMNLGEGRFTDLFGAGSFHHATVQMSALNTWADVPEIHALATSYGRRVEIFVRHPDTHQLVRRVTYGITDDNVNGTPFRLLFVNNDHYHSLQMVNADLPVGAIEEYAGPAHE